MRVVTLGLDNSVTFHPEGATDVLILKRILEVFEHGGQLECRPVDQDPTTISYDQPAKTNS